MNKYFPSDGGYEDSDGRHIVMAVPSVHVLEYIVLDRWRFIRQQIRTIITQSAEQAREEEPQIDQRIRDIELTESMEDLSYSGIDDSDITNEKVKLILDLRDGGMLDETTLKVMFDRQRKMRRILRHLQGMKRKLSLN
jgi:hypothetical protein